MSRPVHIGRPGLAGEVTDLDPYALVDQAAALLRDGIADREVVRERFGWHRDGELAQTANQIESLSRRFYALKGETITMLAASAAGSWELVRHNAAGVGTQVYTRTTTRGRRLLRRATYRDEEIWCFDDGETGLLRYSGSDAIPSNFSSDGDWSAGKATYTDSTPFDGAVQPGSYLRVSSARAWLDLRVLERVSSSVLTLEGVQASGDLASSRLATPVARAYPAVVVYNAGTISVSGGTVTGTGTKFNTGDWGRVNGSSTVDADAVVLYPTTPGGQVSHGTVITGPSDTSFTALLPAATNAPFAITRPLPFKDFCVWQGSPCGAGVKQYPNTLYIGPPDWNLSLPPGAVEPYDPTVAFDTTNPQDFLMQTVPIPGPFDGDPIVAILPTSGPLLVVKERTVYFVEGSYPNFTRRLGLSGIGCIDIRSAISVDEGAFFASREGLIWYVNGSWRNLNEGVNQQEWRDLVNGGVDYVTVAATEDHVQVIFRTQGGTERAWWVKLPRGKEPAAWFPVSNILPRTQYTVRIAGEVERLLGAQDDENGRIADYRPVITGKVASSDYAEATEDAGPQDGNAVFPTFELHTGTALAKRDGLDGEVKVLDANVDVTFGDTGQAARLTVELVVEGALEDPDEEVITLGTVTPEASALTRRIPFDDVNASGRQVSLRFRKSTPSAGQTLLAIPQATLEVRDLRSGT
jgi:hypothetical protein